MFCIILCNMTVPIIVISRALPFELHALKLTTGTLYTALILNQMHPIWDKSDIGLHKTKFYNLCLHKTKGWKCACKLSLEGVIVAFQHKMVPNITPSRELHFSSCLLYVFCGWAARMCGTLLNRRFIIKLSSINP